jgi:hypothetical protein
MTTSSSPPSHYPMGEDIPTPNTNEIVVTKAFS